MAHANGFHDLGRNRAGAGPARSFGYVTSAQLYQRPIGDLLKQWRERRRMSQLDLSIQAEVSTRHLSFVETGRAKPSREMILHLADELEVPLRERNHLLLAAGYAPVYTEMALEAPELGPVRKAIAQLLKAHEPYPAAVIDRRWNLVDANASTALFTASAAPGLLKPPINVLRLSLHPDGLAPRVANLGEWRAHLLSRLRRQINLTADADLTALYDELRGYPCDQPEPEVELPGPGDIAVPLRVRADEHSGGHELTFLSTMSTFGTPLDITVAELSIESFFPADDATAEYLNGRSR